MPSLVCGSNVTPFLDVVFCDPPGSPNILDDLDNLVGRGIKSEQFCFSSFTICRTSF